MGIVWLLSSDPPDACPVGSSPPGPASHRPPISLARSSQWVYSLDWLDRSRSSHWMVKLSTLAPLPGPASHPTDGPVRPSVSRMHTSNEPNRRKERAIRVSTAHFSSRECPTGALGGRGAGVRIRVGAGVGGRDVAGAGVGARGAGEHGAVWPAGVWGRAGRAGRSGRGWGRGWVRLNAGLGCGSEPAMRVSTFGRGREV